MKLSQVSFMTSFLKTRVVEMDIRLQNQCYSAYTSPLIMTINGG